MCHTLKHGVDSWMERFELSRPLPPISIPYPGARIVASAGRYPNIEASGPPISGNEYTTRFAAASVVHGHTPADVAGGGRTGHRRHRAGARDGCVRPVAGRGGA